MSKEFIHIVGIPVLQTSLLIAKITLLEKSKLRHLTERGTRASQSIRKKEVAIERTKMHLFKIIIERTALEISTSSLNLTMYQDLIQRLIFLNLRDAPSYAVKETADLQYQVL